MRRVAPGAVAAAHRRRVGAARGRGRRARARERGRDRTGDAIRGSSSSTSATKTSSALVPVGARARRAASRCRSPTLARDTADPAARRATRCATRSTTRRAAERVELRVPIEVEGIRLIADLVAAGAGVSILPETAVAAITRRCARSRIARMPPRRLALVTARGVQLSLADQAVHDVVRPARRATNALRTRLGVGAARSGSRSRFDRRRESDDLEAIDAGRRVRRAVRGGCRAPPGHTRSARPSRLVFDVALQHAGEEAERRRQRRACAARRGAASPADPAAGAGSTHQRGCMFGPCAATWASSSARVLGMSVRRPRAARPCRALRAASGTLPSTPGRDTSMFTGWKPAPRTPLERGGEVGHLEREVVRTGAVPRDEAGEEVVLVDRPRFEQLDRHAVAVGDRRATPASAGSRSHWPPKMTVPPSVAGEEAQRVRGVGRGERDVVEVVAVGHEAGRSRRGDGATGRADRRPACG